jgi:hypothetical protein
MLRNAEKKTNFQTGIQILVVNYMKS